MEGEVIVAGSVLHVPAELAAALVAAQVAVGAVAKLGENKQLGGDYKYATSDAIGSAAKAALNGAGAAFVRLGTRLAPPALEDYDIGSQGYAGDVLERWMIVHESGAALVGTTSMPVIVSRGRPHEKAVSASLTYGSGVTLRGVLCIEREDKHAVDQRQDAASNDPISRRGDSRRAQKSRGPSSYLDAPGSRCTGKAAGIAKGNRDRTKQLAGLHKAQVKDVWVSVCGEAEIPAVLTPQGPECPTTDQLLVVDGMRIREMLDAKIDACQVEREPGDDGHEQEPLALDPPGSP